METPDEFEDMTELEREFYYKDISTKYAYIDRLRKNVFCAIQQNSILKKKDVKSRIIEYHELYSRMISGFQMGELLMRREISFNMGILSYTSNAPTRMLFNILAVMNLEEHEVLFSMSCDVNQSFDMLPIFTKMLQSINIVDDSPRE